MSGPWYVIKIKKQEHGQKTRKILKNTVTNIESPWVTSEIGPKS